MIYYLVKYYTTGKEIYCVIYDNEEELLDDIGHYDISWETIKLKEKTLNGCSWPEDQFKRIINAETRER